MASTALRRPVGHDDRLSLVDHLDELRSRLIITLAIVAAAVALCFAFNGTLLHIINKPLDNETQKNVNRGRGPLGQTSKVAQGVRDVGAQVDRLAATLADPSSKLPARTRERIQLQKSLERLPKISGNKPVTLGVGEPFSNTLLVSLYFGLLLAMPFILWQLYAFVLPAFSPEERRVAMPLLLMIPGLFLLGVAFGYFLVLPAAVRF